MKRNTVPWQFLDDYRGSLFTGEWPTVPQLFTISTQRYPESPCFTVYEPDRVSLSYSEALERVRRIAGYLRQRGIAPGERVGVSGANSPEWAVAYLAVLYAGAVVVPIDYALSAAEIRGLLSSAGAKALFIDGEKYDAFIREDFSSLVCLNPGKDPYIYDLEADPLEKPLAVDDEELAAILYTSGTTGRPKGVMLTHRNLVADCLIAQANLNIYHSDVFYALLPIHHSYSMLAVFIESLSVGAETVFGKRMVVKQILHDLKAANVTMFLGVPMLFNRLLQGIMKGIRAKGPVVYGIIRGLMFLSGTIKVLFRVNPGKILFKSVLDKASLASIRICISGGGPLAPSVFRQYNQLGIDFVQGYGLTETSPIVALNPKEQYKVRSVGRILPGTEVKILDPDSEGRGEIAIKGPMVMRGYYQMPEETAEVFTDDGFFRTGDVGYLDRDNYLYLTGRAKNLIVTEGGKNVYPEELEDAFQLYNEIEQIMIRGFTLDKRTPGERIEALIYPNRDLFEEDLRDEDEGDHRIRARIEAIVAEVNTKLHSYQKIERVTVLDTPMEMTTTKKIRRHVVEKNS
ncbi:long-chain fatty acid--CoA ligase [Marispirochaeta aestuarii]|uniref:Long-chain fatty acid--CoA ligase n=1 Tax=Marispirochaeta aestuarii TaxID=1963862 RepID=A0A1Y1RZV2_9SPIO|nr:AMP-dependent synthetase/ligase [Marispirochaeta aestuarii]ORC36277.1 long-chain fatty acid--CoA ligase [Marispirochaeta aestuarii]